MMRRPPLLEPEAGYALWAETYAPWAHNELMRVEQEAMEALLEPLTPARALDLGTGTGRYLRVLARDEARRVAGIDRSMAMLRRAHAPRSHRVCADARSLPFAAEAFDLVLASLMVGDIRDLPLWAREAARVLAPSGSLLYSDFHPSWRARKWERTFESRDGRRWRLPYHPHALEDHRAALGAAGLELREIREPRFGDHSVAVVLHASKR